MTSPSTSPSERAEDLDPLATIFPGPSGLGAPRRPHRLRRVAVGGAAVAALLVGGVAVSANASSEGGGLRTATAATRSVEQVLDSVGTIEPVSQAAVAFPVGGTVSDVFVKEGDAVVVGSPLAQLDTAALERTLHQRQQTLADAELALQKALDGEDPGTTGDSGGPSPSGGTGGSGGSGSTDTGSGSSSGSGASTRSIEQISAKASADSSTTTTTSTTPSATAPSGSQPAAPSGASSGDELARAQQAVLDAQQAVDASLAAAQAALDTATAVCAPAEAPAAPATSTTTSTPTAGSDLAAADGSAADGATSGTDAAACVDALRAVLAAQQQVATDQAALAEASVALTALLEEEAAGSGGAGGTGGSTSGGSTSGGSSPGSSTGGPTSGTTGGSTGSSSTGSTTSTYSPSAEELVALQKAVDAAEAAVAVADQAIAQATIVSPVAGTVVSVGFAVGEEVSAGSSTQTIVVQGAGGYEVTTLVSVDDIRHVEVGQPASVRPDGSKRSIRGEVVRIGVAGSSSGTTTTYPVTISLTGDTSSLGNGATASVSIVTDAAARVLAVPTSAVSVDGSRHTVRVVDGSEVTDQRVTVGAVGSTWTEITDGLQRGDEVVLADLDKPLPGSATSSANGGSGNGPGGGRFVLPGGGGPPGFGVSGGRPGG